MSIEQLEKITTALERLMTADAATRRLVEEIRDDTFDAISQLTARVDALTTILARSDAGA